MAQQVTAWQTGPDCLWLSRATALQMSEVGHRGMAAANSSQAEQQSAAGACYFGACRYLMLAVQSHLHCFQEHLWGVVRCEVWEVVQKDGKADG